MPVEAPALVYEIVRLHLESHGYSVSELSARLGLSEHEFKARFLPGPEWRLRAV